MATTRDASAAIAALKTTPRPGFIRFKEFDSETTAQVAVPNVKRWKGKVKKILEGLPWEWIEPLDPKGNIMGPRVDNEKSEVAGDLEDLELPEVSLKGSSELALLQGLTTLMLKAQDVALSRQSQAYGVVLDNNQKLLKTVADRLSSMERHAQQSFEVITSLHNRLNLELHEDGAGDGKDPLEKLVAEVVGDVAREKILGKGKPDKAAAEGATE